jgi:hypothetical protein
LPMLMLMYHHRHRHPSSNLPYYVIALKTTDKQRGTAFS